MTEESPAHSDRITVLTGRDRRHRVQQPEVFIDGAVAWQGDRILEVGRPDRTHGGLPRRAGGRRHGRSDPSRSGQSPPPLLLEPRARSRTRAGSSENFGEILDGLWWRLDRALDRDTIRTLRRARPRRLRSLGHDHGLRPPRLAVVHRREPRDSSRKRWTAPGCPRCCATRSPIATVTSRPSRVSTRTSPSSTARRNDPRIRGMLGFHASFTVDDETLAAAAERRLDWDGLPHPRRRRRPRSQNVQADLRLGGPSNASIASDSSTTGPSPSTASISGAMTARLLADGGATIVHNPESNANNGVGRLDLRGAAADGCRVGLGTDGMSSAMLGALRAAFLGLRGGQRDPDGRLHRGAGTSRRQRRGCGPVLRRTASRSTRTGRAGGSHRPRLGATDARHPGQRLRPPGLRQRRSHRFGTRWLAGRFLLEDHRFTTVDPAAIADEARAATPALWDRFHALGASQPEWLPTKDCTGHSELHCVGCRAPMPVAHYLGAGAYLRIVDAPRECCGVRCTSRNRVRPAPDDAPKTAPMSPPPRPPPSVTMGCRGKAAVDPAERRTRAMCERSRTGPRGRRAPCPWCRDSVHKRCQAPGESRSRPR